MMVQNDSCWVIHIQRKPSIFIDQNFKFKTGTPQEYMSFLKREILPHFETRLAFTIGLASVISSDLMEHGDIGTMVLNFWVSLQLVKQPSFSSWQVFGEVQRYLTMG